MFYLPFQISYYTQVLVPPNANATPEVRATTVVLQVAKRLFERELLTKYTWSGKTLGGGTRIAFRQYENISKLFHAIVLQYVAGVTLELVTDLLYKKVIKHVKQRAGNMNARQTVGRKSSVKKRSTTIVEVPITSGQGAGTTDEINKNRESDSDSTDDENLHEADTLSQQSNEIQTDDKHKRKLNEICDEDEDDDDDFDDSQPIANFVSIKKKVKIANRRKSKTQ